MPHYLKGVPRLFYVAMKVLHIAFSTNRVSSCQLAQLTFVVNMSALNTSPR